MFLIKNMQMYTQYCVRKQNRIIPLKDVNKQILFRKTLFKPDLYVHLFTALKI